MSGQRGVKDRNGLVVAPGSRVKIGEGKGGIDACRVHGEGAAEESNRAIFVFCDLAPEISA